MIDEVGQPVSCTITLPSGSALHDDDIDRVLKVLTTTLATG